MENFILNPLNLYPFGRRQTSILLLCTGLTLLSTAHAQSSPQGNSALQTAFNTAWNRQPEARSAESRQTALAANQAAAEAFTPEPIALEFSANTDQLNRNEGNREYVASVAIPLWLPGERGRSGALAAAETKADNSRTLAAQLRIATSLRDAWWSWQKAYLEHALAGDRLIHAQQLAKDVLRRVKAGDLAPADQHQADGAVASAEADLADNQASLVSAIQTLRSLTGAPPPNVPNPQPEPIPAPTTNLVGLPPAHPALMELQDQAQVSRRSAELAATRTRGNPELVLESTRERSTFGEDWQQTMTFGLRIPLGSDDRNRSRIGKAQAEALEAEIQLQLQHERLAADLETSQTRMESTRTQLAAADKRAQLARETRAFFDKSFRLGETDLPTRLRIEQEATEAERQAVRARIDLAAAISSLRQAMGLLPE